MTMVEKIARAIYEQRNGRGCTPWGHHPQAYRKPYRGDARAALQAMVDDPGDLLDELEPILDDNIVANHREEILSCWRAMLTKALSEAEEEGK